MIENVSYYKTIREKNMKYCSHCGAEIANEAVVCVKCGCETAARKTETEKSTLKTIAKVFMVLGCIASAGAFLIPLCWTIPMTVKYWNDVNLGRPTGTAFKVCSLLFVNTVAGILMLCDNSDK